MDRTGETLRSEGAIDEREGTSRRPYRLLHSSGELVFGNVQEACAAMRQRPGARVFATPDR